MPYITSPHHTASHHTFSCPRFAHRTKTLLHFKWNLIRKTSHVIWNLITWMRCVRSYALKFLGKIGKNHSNGCIARTTSNPAYTTQHKTNIQWIMTENSIKYELWTIFSSLINYEMWKICLMRKTRQKPLRTTFSNFPHSFFIFHFHSTLPSLNYISLSISPLTANADNKTFIQNLCALWNRPGLAIQNEINILSTNHI